jgi:aminoglycoside phosphotransferase (APT) family kinase protein
MNSFEQRVHALCQRLFVDCGDLIDCQRLTAGASQETYRIEIDCAGQRQRFAMRRVAGGQWGKAAEQIGLRVEAQLIDLARSNGVPEPAILHVLEPDDELGEGFVMDWLDGETLGSRIVRAGEFDAIRPHLARQCGEILARIHAIDIDASGLSAQLDHLTPEAFVNRQWQQYQAYSTPQPMIDFTARWLLEHLPPETKLTLVHNDFRNGNLMISPQDGIVGVLDWEVAHIGDPMRDLGWLCTNSWRFGNSAAPVGGFGERADLYAGYTAVSGHAIDPERVRYWEVFGSFWWAIGCLFMAEHYRNGPDRSVERPAIGRRSSECQVDCVNLLIPGDVLAPSSEARLSSEMPRTDELVSSVRDYLRADVVAETAGRTQYLCRVAANALDIVLRDFALGPAARAAEQERLKQLLGRGGELETLRWDLVNALRDGSMPLAKPGLAAHLRQTVVDQVSIDQPNYSGLRTALAGQTPA